MLHTDTPHPAGCTCPACAGRAGAAAVQARLDDRPGPDSLHGAASAGEPDHEDLDPELDELSAAALRAAEARLG